MCDRCSAGLSFLGLAEPQEAMLTSYVVALKSGWRPETATDTAADLLQSIDDDRARFLRERADRIERAQPGDDNSSLRYLYLTRWMWDGEFCGEISLVYDAEDPIKIHQTHVACSLVPSKSGHDYCERARRQIAAEAATLGLTG